MTKLLMPLRNNTPAKPMGNHWRNTTLRLPAMAGYTKIETEESIANYIA